MGAYLSVLGMAVLGSRMAHADHPFFAIVSVSQPLSTQRADAIYLLVFVMLCVLRINPSSPSWRRICCGCVSRNCAIPVPFACY